MTQLELNTHTTIQNFLPRIAIALEDIAKCLKDKRGEELKKLKEEHGHAMVDMELKLYDAERKLKHAQYKRTMAMSKYCIQEATRFHLFSNNSKGTSIYREIIHERDKWRKRSDKWLSLALAQKYK